MARRGPMEHPVVRVPHPMHRASLRECSNPHPVCPVLRVLVVLPDTPDSPETMDRLEYPANQARMERVEDRERLDHLVSEDCPDLEDPLETKVELPKHASFPDLLEMQESRDRGDHPDIRERPVRMATLGHRERRDGRDRRDSPDLRVPMDPWDPEERRDQQARPALVSARTPRLSCKTSTLLLRQKPQFTLFQRLRVTRSRLPQLPSPMVMRLNRCPWALAHWPPAPKLDMLRCLRPETKQLHLWASSQQLVLAIEES